MSFELHHGDCIDVLASMDAESVHAIVQDPPAGIGFMGRDWDDQSSYSPRTPAGRAAYARFGPVAADALEACGQRALAAQLRTLELEPWELGFVCFLVDVFSLELRVAKPGAHSLTWALPRTADLTTLALRLAGWEVRDSLVHLFGQGFPKSHDVSKAIDKLHGATRDVIGRGRKNGGASNGRSSPSVGYGCETNEYDITAPATDDARQWEGWGTALSPGHEVWVLARKPLAGTVAKNVLAHGTGAINVDGCRTATNEQWSAKGHAGTWNSNYRDGDAGEVERGGSPLGRWPKNALLSCALACDGDLHSPGCPVAELDRQSGYSVSKPGDAAKTYVRPQVGAYGQQYEDNKYARSQHSDSGGASRFFPRFGYHPKASDRSVPDADLVNKHPTHKHPDLMRWLVRLVTPPLGKVLDPFTGSGTTGVAALREGVRFIGVEQDPEHYAVAHARIIAEAKAISSARMSKLQRR